MVVTMCRTNTMTGQTIVIDSGGHLRHRDQTIGLHTKRSSHGSCAEACAERILPTWGRSARPRAFETVGPPKLD